MCVGACECVSIHAVGMCVCVCSVPGPRSNTDVSCLPPCLLFHFWQQRLSRYRKTCVTCLLFFHTITFIVCLKMNNLWISLFQDLWNPSLPKASLYALAARRTTDLLCAASRTAAKCYCEPSQTSHWQTFLTHKRTSARRADFHIVGNYFSLSLC